MDDENRSVEQPHCPQSNEIDRDVANDLERSELYKVEDENLDYDYNNIIKEKGDNELTGLNGIISNGMENKIQEAIKILEVEWIYNFDRNILNDSPTLSDDLNVE